MPGRDGDLLAVRASFRLDLLHFIGEAFSELLIRHGQLQATLSALAPTLFVVAETGSRRNQASNDDVLLQATQVIPACR